MKPLPNALFFAVLAGAAAGVGCTDRAAGPPVAPEHVLTAGDGVRWWRGNLHAHTRASDGADDAATVAAWYRDHGYDFLAITDHDRVPDAAAWRALVAAESRPGRFLLLRGEEVSNLVGEASVHVNAFGVKTAVPRAAADDVVGAIHATAAAAAQPSPALLQVNHPNAWFSVTAEHLMRQRDAPLFEVFNAHELSENAGNGLYPSTERLWDIALAWRLDVLGLPPLYGTATDDSHAPSGQPAGPGRAWVRVLAGKLAPAPLFDALRHGRFYASTGVELTRIVAAPTQLAVDVAAEPGVDYVIEFVGTRRGFDTASRPSASAGGRELHASRIYSDDIGVVFARVEGPSAGYRLQPDDLYVRARVTSSRRHPDPSQPMQFEMAWVQPVVGPAGRAPNRPDVPLPDAVPASLHAAAHRFAPLSTDVGARLLATPTARCTLELVADGAGRKTDALKRGDRAIFGGWLVDPASDRAPDALTVVLDGDVDYHAAAGPGRARPDVAAAFAKPGWEAAGFTVDFALADVVAGTYRIRLVAHRDGASAACDTERTLQVD